MIEPKKNQLVTQSNKLIEARYSLTLYEQRLVLMMISMIEPDDEDFKDYAIKVSDFNTIIGINHKGSYSKIKGVLRGLRAKELLINQGGKDYLITGWISDAEYRDNEGVVLLSFSNKLKPYLLALKENFTTQRLNILIKFRGTYTIRIYSFLKQYEKIGVREVGLSTFRNMLDLEDSQYPSYGDFKRRVIKPALKEFEKKDSNGCYKSDLTFKLEEEKIGRKVCSLRFFIIRQDTTKNIIDAINDLSQVISNFEELGIKQHITLPYLKEDGEEALERTLQIFKRDKKAGKIRGNDDGYIIGLLKAKAGVPTEAERKKQEEQERLKKEKMEQKKLEAIEEKRISLSKAFLKSKKEAYLSSLSEEQKQELLEDIRAAYEGKPFIQKMIKNITSGAIQEDINFLVKSQEGYADEEEAYIKANS